MPEFYNKWQTLCILVIFFIEMCTRILNRTEYLRYQNITCAQYDNTLIAKEDLSQVLSNSSRRCFNVVPIVTHKLWLLAVFGELARQYFYHIMQMRRIYTGDSPKTDPTRTYRFQRQILPYNARLYPFFENPQILIVRCIPNFLLARLMPFLA